MAEITIRVNKDGPYVVQGPITLTDAAGKAFATEERVFLCRCGQSAGKPFCDGTHKRVGFESEVRPA